MHIAMSMSRAASFSIRSDGPSAEQKVSMALLNPNALISEAGLTLRAPSDERTLIFDGLRKDEAQAVSLLRVYRYCLAAWW